MTSGLFGGPVIGGDAHVSQRRDRLTFRGNVAGGRHGWLRLTPAYSLHLVRELLESRDPHERVLEPFSGTGTTPLVCSALGVACDALDINPFLVWLGNLKLAAISGEAAEDVRRMASEIVERRAFCGASSWTPDLHQIEKWWSGPTLEALAAIFGSILREESRAESNASDLLRIAFCRTLIQHANVTFGHQSMSFKKPTDDGLIGSSRTSDVEDVFRTFLRSANDIADSITADTPVAAAAVHLGDARDMRALPRNDYTRVITSPPYPNRMSYIRELRPYMYWLGYLRDGRHAGELDWQAIGGTWGCATSLLNTWSPGDSEGIPFVRFDRIVSAIGQKHVLLGRYVERYFHDIKGHIAALEHVIAPAAKCHYIVGNSKFYETVLPVEEIYAAMFEDAGFERVRIDTIRKRTSKKELYEFIVHAERPAEKTAGAKRRSTQ